MGQTGHITVALLLLASGGLVRAEIDLDLAFGAAYTNTSQVDIERSGPTSLGFDGVSWDGRSFEEPLYYSLRVTYWPNRWQHWGVSLDFTHAKAEGRLDEFVDVSGVRDGTPVAGPEMLGDTFEFLNFSHGHNMVTINGNYRFGPPARLRPYVGFGAGVAIPRVEVGLEDSTTDEYQVAGPTLLVIGGVDLEALSWLTFALEYKLSYSRIDADLQDGGSLATDLWTHHLTLGASFRFGKKPL